MTQEQTATQPAGAVTEFPITTALESTERPVEQTLGMVYGLIGAVHRAGPRHHRLLPRPPGGGEVEAVSPGWSRTAAVTHWTE